MTARTKVNSCQDSEGLYDLPVKKPSKKASCLKCYAGGNILVCSHDDCPVVLHQSCMSCTPWVNDHGNFCCPYCMYKQSLVECRKAQEKVLLAKKALSYFLDMKIAESIGNLQNSKSMKRKRPETQTSMQNGNDATCIRVGTRAVCQSRPVEHLGLAIVPLAAGPPNNSCHWGNETSPKENESMTINPQENQCTMEAYKSGHNGTNEKTKAEPRKTFCFLSKTGTDVHGESKKGSFKPILDDCFTCLKEVNSDDVEEPAEIGEDNSSGANEVQKSGAHLMEDEDVLVARILTGMHQVNLKTIEGLDEGVEKVQVQSNPEETSICSTRKDNIMRMPEEHNKGNDNIMRDDFSARSQMETHSEDAEQPAKVVECHSGYEEGTLLESPKHAGQIINEDIVSMMNVESRNSMKQQVFAKIKEGLHNAGTIKKQILGELQESCVCLNRKENTKEFHEECNKENNSPREDIYYASSAVEMSSEIADLAESRDNHAWKDNRQDQLKSPKDVLHVKRQNFESTIHEESEILYNTDQGTGDEAKRYHDGGAGKEHLQSEIQQNTFHLNTGVDAMRIYEISDQGNKCVFLDGDFVRKDMTAHPQNADQPAESGDNCGKPDERNREKLPADNVQPMEETLMHEESDSGSNSASTTSSCSVGHGVTTKWRSHMQESLKNVNLHGQLSESSEKEFSEFEDCEEVAHHKSGKKRDKIKQRMKRSGLYSTRRKKLPWTVEEVEMLKEGMQKFSSAGETKLPWVKILEFGRHVFDGTRTPVDLKDKWRNLMGKGL